MAYNTKTIIRDVNNKPVPQYYNPILDKYEVIESDSGKLKVSFVDKNGSYIQSQQLVDQISVKLDELIGVINNGI